VANISEAVSQKIKNMSIVCAILVVTIHVSFPESGISWVWNRTISHGVAAIAVPYFFAVSGFFLAGHFGDCGWYRHEIQKRIGSLLFPFLIWVLIATCLVTPLSIIADVIAHRPFGSSPPFTNGRWLMAVGLDLRQGPACLGALWYVRCLLMFVLLSPIFKLLVKRLGIIWLMIAFVLTLFHRSTQWPCFSDLRKVFDLGFSLSGVFYFSLGIWLRTHITDLHIERRWSYICFVVSVLLLSLNTVFVYHDLPTHVHLITIAIPFIMYSMWTVMPSAKWPTWFTASSFPLFLMHMPLIPYFSLPIKHTALAGTLEGGVIILLGSIVTPLIVVAILNKHYPKVSRLLFAGRS